MDKTEWIALLIVGVALFFVIRRLVIKKKKDGCCGGCGEDPKP